MWSFSARPSPAFPALLCILAASLAVQPVRAEGVFGRIWAPSKRIGKATLRQQVEPGSLALVPLQKQEVDLCTLGGRTCQTQFTDSDGYFEFDGLTAGSYVLRTRGSDGGSVDTVVQVLPGEMKELSVVAR